MGEKRTGGGMNAGFLFLYDWLPGFAALPATDLKQLFLALIARQKDGAPLPTFKRTTTQALAQIIEVTIKRRLGGRDGGEKNQADKDDEGVPLTPTLTPMEGRGTAKHSIREQSIREHSIAEHSIREHSVGDQDIGESPATDSRPLPKAVTVGRETGARRSPSGNPSATPKLGYDDDEAREDGILEERDEGKVAGERWFEDFWEVYPKKVGVDEAEHAFYAVVVDKESFDRVMAGLSAWCASEEWREQNGRFVPRAAAFLRDRRYLMPPGGLSRRLAEAGGTRKDRGASADPHRALLEAERESMRTFDIDDFFEAALRRSYGEGAV